jgi:hypothetical protein
VRIDIDIQSRAAKMARRTRLTRSAMMPRGRAAMRVVTPLMAPTAKIPESERWKAFWISGTKVAKATRSNCSTKLRPKSTASGNTAAPPVMAARRPSLCPGGIGGVGSTG